MRPSPLLRGFRSPSERRTLDLRRLQHRSCASLFKTFVVGLTVNDAIYLQTNARILSLHTSRATTSTVSTPMMISSRTRKASTLRWRSERLRRAIEMACTEPNDERYSARS